ncbi:TerD family protein [Cryobacterium psychrophilum]|uniref:TerD domain-containing protein n=1 Tax=Cryobacterium psychrophilum TaxID=41988 RepID=A0A4Y8KLI1_9MICO|nr:TerD family protein [Cryobacterium psychrophilum]TFD78429.1 hypothetical protein E3T53_09545 [Cryobacterium psychrophilum]
MMTLTLEKGGNLSPATSDPGLLHARVGEEIAVEKSVLFAEIYKHSGEWKFRANGQGYTDGLGGIARDHGIHI